MADNSDTNRVSTVVTDANGNPISGVAVFFSANNGATITGLRPDMNGDFYAITGSDGSVTANLTSFIMGTSTVTASIFRVGFGSVDAQVDFF
ncbi:hypothetical protein DPY73_23030 [Salmonella enterica subsp. enterica]|nr:hypothetical protein [Salmonella enterica subsp. enterica serovar Braenderup]